MLFKGVIIVAAIALVVILWAVFAQDISDSEGLQNAIDECTNTIDNMGPSNLENCLDDAYNQYGSEEQKQSWFDDDH
jgi:low affinity Fe/Cu permease